MKFTEFKLDKKILQGIKDAGFETCTQVQAESYPITIEGNDVLVQSQTGSGKTAAFLIPTFSRLLEKGGKALIVAPTRELAIQIDEESELLAKNTGLKSCCFYGGTGYTKQEQALKDDIDIVIGTPGRLLDFGKSGKIKFNSFSIIVIDEADRLFDMGFYPDIQSIMKKAVKPAQRQTMLFSATLSQRVRQLAWEFMNEPKEVEIEAENITVDEIDQSIFHVSTSEKMNLLLGLLKRENPKTVLVFTNTKNQAAILSERLNYNGYKSMFLSGDLPQKKRVAVINKVKNGELSALIATDVAARGLHIDDLSLVINYDVPEDFEVYVHRIGRTGRAGNKGKAITLACEKFVYALSAIEDYIGQKIPVEWVEDSLLIEDLSKGKYVTNPYRTSNQNSRNGQRNSSRPNNSGNGQRNSSRPNNSGNNQRDSSRPNNRGRDANYSTKKTNNPNNANRNQTNNFTSTNRNQVINKPKILNLKKPDKNSSEADRIAYYKAKYGENFNPRGTVSTNKKRQNHNQPTKGNKKKQYNKQTTAKESKTDKNTTTKKPIKQKNGIKRLFNKFKKNK